MATIVLKPADNIQSAVNSASIGDTIYLTAGTYRQIPRIQTEGVRIVGEVDSNGKRLATIHGGKSVELSPSSMNENAFCLSEKVATDYQDGAVFIGETLVCPAPRNNAVNWITDSDPAAVEPEKVGDWEAFFAYHQTHRDQTHLRTLQPFDASDVTYNNTYTMRIERDGVMVENVRITGGMVGCAIEGNRNHITVDNCEFVGGHDLLQVLVGPSNIQITNNVFKWTTLGRSTGAWSAEGDEQPNEPNKYGYRHWKDRSPIHWKNAINLRYCGDDILVEGNQIIGGQMGIDVRCNLTATTNRPESKNIAIRKNKIHSLSNCGILINKGAEVEITDNEVFDCNSNLRLHGLDEPESLTAKIRNNRFLQVAHGNNVKTHYNPNKTGAGPVVVDFTGNTCHGGEGLAISHYATQYDNLNQWKVDQNFFSCTEVLEGPWELGFGQFTKNECWGGNLSKLTNQSWWNETNQANPDCLKWSANRGIPLELTK